MSVGKEHSLLIGCPDALEIRRIEVGILDNITMNPWHAGLDTFIDLDKDEDFVDRDGLQAMTNRGSRLFGITCQGTTPDVGNSVMEGHTAVGRISAGAYSPFQQCGIGYVRFAESGGWEGRELAPMSADGSAAACAVVNLPFCDPEKRIPRRLDHEIP